MGILHSHPGLKRTVKFSGLGLGNLAGRVGWLTVCGGGGVACDVIDQG